MTQSLTSFASDLGIVFIAAVIIIGVYLIDMITPLGEPVWLLYFIPLILSYWSSRYYAIPTVCIVTLLFLVGGLFLSPSGVAIKQALLYRFIFVLIFISTSVILWVIRRRQIIKERM
jgi:predicted membrane protein